MESIENYPGKEIYAGNVALAAQLLSGQIKVEEFARIATERQLEPLIDELTGLYGRKFFEIVKSPLLARARRDNSSLGFVILDVDDLKRINDEFGHPAGDEVLRNLGEVIKENIRGSDIAARLGGEEVGLILLNTPLEGVKEVAEKIRMAVEKQRVVTKKGEITYRVSVGGTVVNKEENWDDFYNRADEALYEAKGGGKNKAVIHG